MKSPQGKEMRNCIFTLCRSTESRVTVGEFEKPPVCHHRNVNIRKAMTSDDRKSELVRRNLEHAAMISLQLSTVGKAWHWKELECDLCESID